jgi:UDP-N-acetylglucosamine--N-acetylmuramyl-(pentapeptide) pyrophosphoryl-undecaprenol N-acetylglucosamine transferase
MSNSLRVIISGGGTGGHIFPAIAIANALKEKFPGCEILFVGAKGKMEMDKVPAAGYKIEGLWISGLQRRMTVKNLSVPFKIIASLRKSRGIIRQFRPDVVVGVGGYASWAVVKAACYKGIPTLIQEQNSFPGKSNINLSKKVDKICVAFQGMEKFFPSEKIVLTGNPVRRDMVDIENKKSEALEFFGLTPGKKILFAVGGSLGARTINESISSFLPSLQKKNIQLIWQTGKTYHEVAKAEVEKYSGNGMVTYDFINRMDLAYAAADLVVSRAGAIAVSELCCVGKPVVLVPSPNVAEDHQTKNAMALLKVNAAKLVKDSECRDHLEKVVSEIFDSTEEMQKLSVSIKQLALPDAANAIAEEIKKLSGK